MYLKIIKGVFFMDNGNNNLNHLNAIEKKRIQSFTRKTAMFVGLSTLFTLLMLLFTILLEIKLISLKVYIAILTLWTIVIIVMIWQFLKIRREAKSLIEELGEEVSIS